MKIVIDIPEKAYNALTHTEFDANLVVNEMRKAIVNGKPLPEHHGRLIDADAMQKYQIDTFGQRLLVIDTAPTIIEGSESE